MNETLKRLHDAEARAYYAYCEACRGDDGPSVYSHVSTRRVRRKKAAWLDAVSDIAKAGFTMDDVRAMLANGEETP